MSSTKPCAPPTHSAFDIDIYDCPCGHVYGDHEYRWLDREMIIAKCCECEEPSFMVRVVSNSSAHVTVNIFHGRAGRRAMVGDLVFTVVEWPVVLEQLIASGWEVQ